MLQCQYSDSTLSFSFEGIILLERAAVLLVSGPLYIIYLYAAFKTEWLGAS